MPGLTVRSTLAAIAIAAVALGSAASATAAPTGPCEDVPYIGVCQPVGGQQHSPSRQGMGDVVISGGNSGFQTVG
ncbi:MAG: hypothetical protein QOD39_3965 [Mycobacterium sp.]|nr:hypothetical protein [Mycobacterium sp.]